MKNVCLITHVADADGAFPIILAKFVFENLEVYSCDVKEVDATLENVLEHQDNYDIIYIVDLNMSDYLAKKIDTDNNLREKIKVFDHHQSNLFLNKYPFIKVVDEINGHKECGTTLFYGHLKDTYKQSIFDKECLKTLIELIREGDTYDFTAELKEKAFQFGSLYSIYGREKYIEHFYKFILENDKFNFSELDKILIQIEEDKTKKYIAEKMEHLTFANIMNYKVGIVFAEQKRSLLGHEMVKKLDIDVAVIIDIDKSVSYRACKDNIDASNIAVYYQGGGHKHACGSPLPLGLHKKICESIFEEIIWLDDKK